MPNPIPFSVAPAPRGTPQGQVFNSPSIPMQAGWTKITWQFDIPSNADYENPANHVLSQLLVNGVDAATTWTGGPGVDKAGNVDPPVIVEFAIGQVPAGATLQVRLTVTAPVAFNIGISNGLVS